MVATVVAVGSVSGIRVRFLPSRRSTKDLCPAGPQYSQQSYWDVTRPEPSMLHRRRPSVREWAVFPARMTESVSWMRSPADGCSPVIRPVRVSRTMTRWLLFPELAESFSFSRGPAIARAP